MISFRVELKHILTEKTDSPIVQKKMGIRDIKQHVLSIYYEMAQKFKQDSAGFPCGNHRFVVKMWIVGSGQ
jgi:hypothetical protein